MPRTKGAIDLPEAKRGALIELKKENSTLNRQLTRKYRCEKSIVANILKRAEEAEKENIDSLSLEAHQRRSHLERPLAINERQQRQLIRHAIKNKFQPITGCHFWSKLYTNLWRKGATFPRAGTL